MSLQEPTTEQVLEERSNIGDKVDINSALGGVVYKKSRSKRLCLHNRRKDNCTAVECGGCIHKKRKTRCSLCNYGELPEEPLEEETTRETTTRGVYIRYMPISCAFCRKEQRSSSRADASSFCTHPYVFADYTGSTLYLCSDCNTNWRLYRQKANDDGYLLLTGEQNEEICAICSDAPESELVLCSVCPRSYCLPCLTRILRPSDLDIMNAVENWTCMVCAAEEVAMKSLPSWVARRQICAFGSVLSCADVDDNHGIDGADSAHLIEGKKSNRAGADDGQEASTQDADKKKKKKTKH